MLVVSDHDHHDCYVPPKWTPGSVITIAYSDVIHTDDNPIEIIHNNIVLVKDNGNGIPDLEFPVWNDNGNVDEYDEGEDADDNFKF